MVTEVSECFDLSINPILNETNKEQNLDGFSRTVVSNERCLIKQTDHNFNGEHVTLSHFIMEECIVKSRYCLSSKVNLHNLSPLRAVEFCDNLGMLLVRPKTGHDDVILKNLTEVCELLNV